MNVNMIMNIEQQDEDHDQHQHQHQQAWDQVSTLNCQIKQKAGSLNMSIPHGYYWVKEVIPWSCLPIPNTSAAVDELNLWDSNTDLQVYWNGKSIKKGSCGALCSLLSPPSEKRLGCEGIGGWDFGAGLESFKVHHHNILVVWLFFWGGGATFLWPREQNLWDRAGLVVDCGLLSFFNCLSPK